MRTFSLGPAEVIWTGTAEGDLGHRPSRLPHDDTCCDGAARARRDAVLPGPWVRVHQVHGDGVVVARSPDDSGATGDAVVTVAHGLPIAIATADCGPIALASAEGVVGAVHAGWPGLEAGVIGRAVAVMRSLGATDVVAALGPCIHAECYEFDEERVDAFVGRWGTAVRAVSASGASAFDVPAAVAAEVAAAGADLVHVDERCTGCSGTHFSYRSTGTPERQVMLVRRLR